MNLVVVFSSSYSRSLITSICLNLFWLGDFVSSEGLFELVVIVGKQYLVKVRSESKRGSANMVDKP